MNKNKIRISKSFKLAIGVYYIFSNILRYSIFVPDLQKALNTNASTCGDTLEEALLQKIYKEEK